MSTETNTKTNKGGETMVSKDKETKKEQNSNGDQPKALLCAAKGIKTSRDFANYMAALMTDLVQGKITPSTANAACNAGGKLLRVVEMELKHGTKTTSKKQINKSIMLSDE